MRFLPFLPGGDLTRRRLVTAAAAFTVHTSDSRRQGSWMWWSQYFVAPGPHGYTVSKYLFTVPAYHVQFLSIYLQFLSMYLRFLIIFAVSEYFLNKF